MNRFGIIVLLGLALLPSTQAQQPGSTSAMTFDQLNSTVLSGVPYYESLRALGLWRQPGKPRLTSNTAPVNGMVLDTTDLSNDQNHDIEPSVVRAMNTSGTQATIVVATKYDADGANPRNLSYSSLGSTQYLALPSASYTYTGDPVVAWYFGSTSRPVYAAGISSTPSRAPNGIFVWKTTSLGQSWSAATPVVTSDTASVFYDKPSIAVSNSGVTAGYLYVAYTEYDQPTNRYQIWVARSTNGGATFDQHYVPTDSGGVCACGFVSMSSVIVDPSNGTVYVSWADYTRNQVRLAHSATNGDLSAPWTMITNGPTGRFIASTTDTLNGGLRALTIPVARFDAAAHEVVFTWHAREQATQYTDIFFDAYNVNTGSWLAQPVTVNNENGDCLNHTDQFMPALDYDGSGNVLISYYSRQNNCGDTVYDEYFSLLSPSGSRIQGPTLASSFQSDAGLNGFIGDYQDVNGDSILGSYYTTFYSAWIGNPPPNTYQDVLVTRIQ